MIKYIVLLLLLLIVKIKSASIYEIHAVPKTDSDVNIWNVTRRLGSGQITSGEIASISNGFVILSSNFEHDSFNGTHVRIRGAIVDNNFAAIAKFSHSIRSFKDYWGCCVQQFLYVNIKSFANDNFIVSWEIRDLEGSYFSVYGIIFNGAGEKISQEVLIANNTAGKYGYVESAATFTKSANGPGIAVLPNGNFVVSWNTRIVDGVNNGSFAAIFNQNFVKIGDSFKINDGGDITLQSQIESFSNNNFIAVYSTKGKASDTSGYGVYGQMFNHEGNKLGNEIKISTFTEGNQSTPVVAVLSGEKFVVAWSSEFQDYWADANTAWGQEPNTTGIYGRMFNGATPLGEEFKVNNESARNQMNPSVASFSDGKFVVGYITEEFISPSINAQVFDADANTIDSELYINTEHQGGSRAARIATKQNSFTIIWERKVVWGKTFDLVYKEDRNTPSSTSIQKTTSNSHIYGPNLLLLVTIFSFM